jgi:hypothetical protein
MSIKNKNYGSKMFYCTDPQTAKTPLQTISRKRGKRNKNLSQLSKKLFQKFLLSEKYKYFNSILGEKL